MVMRIYGCIFVHTYIRKMTLTVLSLFDGISCGQLALKRLGIDVTYYASEVDKYAIQVTQHHFPNTIQLGDVRNVRYVRHTKQLVCDTGTYDVGDIDLLIGGSPCGGFSAAGNHSKSRAFEHVQSCLLYQYERIRNEVRPRHLLLENVSMCATNIDLITEMVAATPGTKMFKVNSTKYVCQHRQRCYWTNIRYDPTEPVQTDHPLTLKEFFGDGYEGVLMRMHGQYGEAGDRFIADRKVAQTITRNVYKFNSAYRFNGVKKHFSIEDMERLQTLPIGYTEPAGSDTQRSYAIGNGWTVAVIEDIFRGLIP
jgi:site-specific DNA-cytosine methylase